ncbi:MAG: glycerol-3-phosphate 1-O-acyltransferase [Candidatus Syntrophonatronum acetioxidans]|uniref:Glycerol-3-phosphate acyltransferase n=1 Tax=Candidatus Syntrophonatronum acetioxidans TaxID=1795816 RepID=A0A424YCA2_9FIRM|nr:MAG: glycerol-3-phosphate 1-O-acyltransferase [Candidatus Syntrophonatronum acetioxidans]
MVEYMSIIIAYLIGSISFGYIFCKILKGVDIREYGSGSTGATNISRILGFGPALLIFVLDALKGVSALYLTQLFTDNPYLVILAGIAVVAGHNWPVFFGFRGGRGIATSLGVLIGISPLVVLWLLFIGLSIIAVTRYVSLGSVTGAISLPLLMWYFGLEVPYIFFGTLMTIMAVVRHIPNLKRLKEGKESKIGNN